MPQPGHTYRYPSMARVHYGRPFAEAVAEEAALAGAERVFLLTGGTIARETSWPAEIATALGPRFAAQHQGISAHTPRADVLAATAAARSAGADMVVTLGGGSVTDAGKAIRLCLANNVSDGAGFDALATTIGPDGKRRIPDMAAPAIPLVCVPTTLSAGEFSATAGVTDLARGLKQSLAHPALMARAVVLDPALTLLTPDWLFLSTGIRAVDHAVEDICSISGNPFAEGASMQALRLLARGLRGVKADRGDLAARLDCQLGAWMSMVGSQTGVEKGASHGIGHALGGAAGVPHGHTSCVMLPTVLRYNHPVNAAQQALVAEAFGAPGQPAAELVAALVADLGLPGRIRDVGVAHEQFDRIAEMAMHDRWIPTNPRPLPDQAAVRALLEAAW
jgi:maleylacetate reductase